MKRAASRAFTLLELLLSLAVMAALFAAMSQFMFSMGELWGRGAQRRLFDQHVTAVTHHLQDMLLAASNHPDDVAPPAITEAVASGGQPLLTLELPGGDRIFRGIDQSPADIVCFLEAGPEHGLVMRWFSRHAAEFPQATVRATTLSRFGLGIAYEYYDRKSGRLSVQDSPARDGEGHWMLPCRLHLSFAWDNFKAVRAVVVPPQTSGLPDF